MFFDFFHPVQLRSEWRWGVLLFLKHGMIRGFARHRRRFAWDGWGFELASLACKSQVFIVDHKFRYFVSAGN